jgi:CDP-2,3-bis-(O-geranylgeranyl)-sn-glycerol synthase
VSGERLVLRAIQLLYLMAPAYAANMLPPFIRYWRGWNPPLSLRWLGAHKTALVQLHLAWSGAIAVRENWLGVGLRLGAGAMTGDAVKSFFKRRAGIAPGEPWIPFDQMDFALGALTLVWPVAELSWADAAAIVLLSAIGHVVVNHLGYWLGVRSSKW